jgi:membrane-bound serine protease (ClpP class)
VHALTVSGPITPATAEYVARGLATASDQRSEAVLVRINTPGGLLQSTREIVSAFLESPIPVIVYVAPSGSQAGSAGLFITLSGHVAAMAAGTNIGAAHPVGMQGEVDSIMNEKATNDAAAFVRAIAQQRHRNLAWAESAVRNSVALSASEALDSGVVDLLADSDRDLLAAIEGRSIMTSSGTTTLSVANATIEEIPPNFAESLLGILSDPNIAYILFLLGIYGLLFELYNPGSILPGIVGGICLILAFYALHTLPVSYAGVAMIVFAIILFLLEVKVTSHGVLAIGGTIALLLGSAMLIRPASGLELVEISWSVILLSVGMTAFFFLVVIGLGLRAQRVRPSSGADGAIGRIATSKTRIAHDGTVSFQGELWNARSIGAPIAADRRVRILRVDGLTLIVEPEHSGKDKSP